MHLPLATYIAERADEWATIPVERRHLLERLTKFISDRRQADDAVRLVFICTHNSRRSQFAQAWASVAAAHYDIQDVTTYSGGTEVTAFNRRAASALQRAGWRIEIRQPADNDNPVHELSWSVAGEPVRCFSKLVSEPPNPERDFAAVMTCSDADRNCPAVPGATFGCAIPYEDPKISDGTLEEEAIYDERCQQIAREMLYLFSRVE
jgi:arsenate reductase